MGMIDTVIIDSKITLPDFPKELNHANIRWDTKSLLQELRSFRISSEGRLLMKKQDRREMTKEERERYAKDKGYDSWEELKNSSRYDPMRKYITENERWVDCNYHGVFEFHSKVGDNGYDTYFSYEAKFSDGDLDDITFLGDRFSDSWKDSVNRYRYKL